MCKNVFSAKFPKIWQVQTWKFTWIATPPQCSNIPNYKLIDLKVKDREQFLSGNIREKNELLALRPKI